MPTELHRWARPIILDALVESGLADVEVPSVVLAVHGVGHFETGYGTFWKGVGVGSNNWGAVQSGKPPCPLATSFEYTDTHPNPDGTNTTYRICFRRYGSPKEGCAALVREMYLKRPSVLDAARSGSFYGVSKALHETRYYEGHGRTVADRIANHYRAVFARVQAAAKACGDPPPQAWIPTTEPWMHDLSPVHPTLRRGTRHREATRVWQSMVLNPFLERENAATLVADGAFGQLTDAATRWWQGDHGLKRDGVVGPRSWERAEDEYDEDS